MKKKILWKRKVDNFLVKGKMREKKGKIDSLLQKAIVA